MKSLSHLVEVNLPVELTVIATKVVECLSEVLRIFGCDSCTTTHQPTVARYALMFENAGGNWSSVVKYKLASFYSATHDQQLPETPEGIPKEDNPLSIIGGGAGRWLRNAMRTWTAMKRESLAMSILQSKKGMPRPTAQEVELAEKKFAKTITAQQEVTAKVEPMLINWADQASCPSVQPILTQATFKEQLERTVTELFGGKGYKDSDRYKAFVPSTSANYIKSRKGGGAIGFLLQEEEGRAILDKHRTFGGYLKVRQTSNHEDEEMEREDVESRARALEVDPDSEARFGVAWRSFYDSIVDRAIHEETTAEPVGLAESLKVRVITKCPPLTQMAMRPVWKFVHSHLRRHKVFRLIGTPQNEQEILDGLGKNLLPGEVYLSGDYRAATDLLKSWVSETIAKALAKEIGLSLEEGVLLNRSLTQFSFLVEEEDGLNLRKQTTGQLMGSVTSFPVLCIANAAMCRWAMECAELKVKRLQDCALLVNGDDTALRSVQAVYEKWQRITRFGGLEESVGKTFVSPKFVNINSTSFLRTDEPKKILCKYGSRTIERETHLVLVPYVNLGLLYGAKRSGLVSKSDQGSQHSNLSARCRTLLHYAPENLHMKCMRAFISVHRELMESTGLPWYIPEWLGGLGLPRGDWGKPSDLDLRIAARILLRWKEERPKELHGAQKEWKIWQLAQERCPKPVFVTERGPAVERYESVIQRRCIDLIFDRDLHLEDLQDREEQDLKAAINRNRELWKPSHGSKGKAFLPKPLMWNELEFRARYPNFEVEDNCRPKVSEQRSKNNAGCTILD